MSSRTARRMGRVDSELLELAEAACNNSDYAPWSHWSRICMELHVWYFVLRSDAKRMALAVSSLT